MPLATAILAALGQSFYSIGIGTAAAFAFGSYLAPEDSDVPGGAVIVAVLDTCVAILAGLVIFPALFAFGLDPAEGPGLLFVTMTSVFARMPAGTLFGTLFFFLLLLAGITSIAAVLARPGGRGNRIRVPRRHLLEEWLDAGEVVEGMARLELEILAQ